MIKGSAWKYGSNIDTEGIYPPQYLVHFDPVEVARHAMEGIDPAFAGKIKNGDIIVAGDNFGCGSAREQAAMTLKFAGVGAVIADSIARTFYRNAINNGLPVIALKGISAEINEGDCLEVDLQKGVIINTTSQKKYEFEPLDGFLLEILKKGGAIEYYKERMC